MTLKIEDVKKLDDEQLMKQVARFAGWTKCYTDEWCGSHWGHPPGESDAYPGRSVPCFPQDMNAMQKIERTLNDAQYAKYQKICRISAGYRWFSATARQRAEAYAVVMGEEDNAKILNFKRENKKTSNTASKKTNLPTSEREANPQTTRRKYKDNPVGTTYQPHIYRPMTISDLSGGSMPGARRKNVEEIVGSEDVLVPLNPIGANYKPIPKKLIGLTVEKALATQIFKNALFEGKKD